MGQTLCGCPTDNRWAGAILPAEDMAGYRVSLLANDSRFDLPKYIKPA